MSNRRNWIFGGAAAFIAGAAVLVGLAIHYANLPETVDDLETIVLGQSHYVPGSQAALRVLVREVGGGQAIPGAAVTVALQPADGGRPVELFQGTTDELGAADVVFAVPADLDRQTLIVETTSARVETASSSGHTGPRSRSCSPPTTHLPARAGDPPAGDGAEQL
jgi:hypothetical protein